MLDGTMAKTEVISESQRAEFCLDMLLRRMYKHGDMVLGLDIEWPFPESNVCLLTFCSKFGCLLMKLDVLLPFNGIKLKLVQFLTHKDIMFPAVHIQKDVKGLQEEYLLEIRNVVDLSALAAYVLYKPRLRAFGVKSLAHEVLGVPFKARPSRAGNHVTQEQVECAATDAYAAYKIGMNLLGA